jgi:ACS family sodium-dependent inorganic phosphate cotransporter
MLSASGAAGSVWATSLAVVLVTATLATQAVAIAGFHAYLQDVAPAKAGAFLGVTNTLGVFAGIAANVTTGMILEKTGKFTLVFLVTAFVYLSSGAVWERNMKGRVLFA